MADTDDASPTQTDQDPSPAVIVSDLVAAWVSPNWVRWTWNQSGDGSRFESYQVLLGASAQEVTERAATVRIFTEAQNPELGWFVLPYTTAPSPVAWTLTPPHSPGATSFARVEALDRDGLCSASNVAVAVTPPSPTWRITLFDEGLPTFYPLPQEYALSQNHPFSGIDHYAYDVDCEGASSCWQNLKWNDVNVSLSEIGDHGFESAYIEFALSYMASEPSYWTEVLLVFASCHDCVYSFEAFTTPADGVYRVYQFPLSVFVCNGTPLSSETLSSALFQFAIGGQWSAGGRVEVDQVSIAR